MSLADSDAWNTVADVRAFDAGQGLAPNAPMALVNIGDYVWNDYNQDGRHLTVDEQEFVAGINGVKVNLCVDEPVTGSPGVLDAGDDCLYRTTTTGDNPDVGGTQTGWYVFKDVPADSNGSLVYFVQIDASNFSGSGALVGHVLTSRTTFGQGNDYVTVPLTAAFPDADFGFAYPVLTLVKTASPTTYDSVGDVISYSYLLTNNGNVTLVAPFTVTDDKATVTCPATPTSLAPGASITCTASYTITQADLNAGSVKNTAQGHGFFGTTPVPSNNDDETVTADQTPGPDPGQDGEPDDLRLGRRRDQLQLPADQQRQRHAGGAVHGRRTTRPP